jgi:hypothetical protein
MQHLNQNILGYLHTSNLYHLVATLSSRVCKICQVIAAGKEVSGPSDDNESGVDFMNQFRPKFTDKTKKNQMQMYKYCVLIIFSAVKAKNCVHSCFIIFYMFFG